MRQVRCTVQPIFPRGRHIRTAQAALVLSESASLAGVLSIVKVLDYTEYFQRRAERAALEVFLNKTQAGF